MPRILVALLILAIAGSLVVLLFRPDGDGPAAASAPEAPSDGVERPAARPPTDSAVASESPEARVLAPAPSERTEDGTAAELVRACSVSARVVDAAGDPIVGARVRLRAYQDWAEGHDVPRLEGPYDHRGFEVDTDANGAFRIEAPVPTVTRTWLTVEPDRFHDSYRVFFDSSDGRAQSSLQAGERDLGEILLVETGAVRGRVTTSDGLPAENARMGVGPSVGTTYSRDTNTAADGTYVIAHAPIGTYGVSVKLDGYLSQFRSPITVEGGIDTGAVDFILERAPTIEGIVVDEGRSPIEGVRVSGWPTASGSAARAYSEADGRFTLYLPQEDPYMLSAKLDGYRTWGDSQDRSTTFAPGTRDLEIVLVATPKVRFHVVDAATGAPIERFGLRILENNGSRARSRTHTERRRPKLAEHAEGVTEATARPGIDLFVIAADGYLLATGDVEYEENGPAVQRVELRRGATVRGRVLFDDEPVEGALVEIRRGRLRRDRENPNAVPVFRARENDLRSTATDQNGGFELSGLETGAQQLTIRPATGAPLVHLVESLTAGAATDLGDFHLLPGATVRGVVLVPAGVDPSGLKIYLDDWKNDVTAHTNADGAFTFGDLAPGVHTLTLGERPGVLASSEEQVVQLESGETKEITLDARDRGMCTVSLTVDLGEISPQGLQVDLISVADPLERERLGKCDETGRVAGGVRAWGETRVVIWLPGLRQTEFPGERLQLRMGEALERTLRLPSAQLLLRLPDTIQLTAEGTGELLLSSSFEELPAQRIRLRIVNGALEENALVRSEAGDLLLKGLTPGDYALEFRLTDSAAEYEEVPIEGGGYRLERVPYFQAERSVVLVEGQTLELALD